MSDRFNGQSSIVIRPASAARAHRRRCATAINFAGPPATRKSECRTEREREKTSRSRPLSITHCPFAGPLSFFLDFTAKVERVMD